MGITWFLLPNSHVHMYLCVRIRVVFLSRRDTIPLCQWWFYAIRLRCSSFFLFFLSSGSLCLVSFVFLWFCYRINCDWRYAFGFVPVQFIWGKIHSQIRILDRFVWQACVRDGLSSWHWNFTVQAQWHFSSIVLSCFLVVLVKCSFDFHNSWSSSLTTF